MMKTRSLNRLKLHKITRKIRWSAILLVLVPIAYFLRFMLDWNFNIQSLAWFFMAFLAAVHVFQYHKHVAKKLSALFLIDMLALIALMVNHSHNVIYVGILFATQSWGAFLYCERKKLTPLAVVSICIIVFLLFKVSNSSKVLINSWQYGIILSNLVRQNTVSIFLCEFLSYDLIYRYESNKNTNILLFMIAMVTAVICDGMGGILSIAVFFVGILFINRKQDKLQIGKIVCLLVFILLLVIYTGKLNTIVSTVTDDNGRFYIWSNYISCIDSAKDFIFGADVTSNSFLYTANNMHNTLLNWHYCFGVVPTIFFSLRYIKGFIYCVKEKKHVFLVIMCVTFLRAFTDEAEYAFGGIWTFMWLMSEFSIKESNCTHKKHEKF